MPNINFEWGGGSVLGGPSEDVIVRFTGSIMSNTTQTISFLATGDDGTRLYLDGVLITDDWVDKGGGGTTSSPVQFTAGIPKAIELMYYENGGGANVFLHWDQSGSMDIIPASAFTSQPVQAVKTIGPPRNLTVVDGSTATVLTWEAPNTGNTQPERYAISFTTEGQNGWGIATGNVGDSNALNTTISIDHSLLESLMPIGTVWSFHIRSDNDTLSLYSENSNTVTLKIGKTTEEIAAEQAAAKAIIDAENARLAEIARLEEVARLAEIARVQAEAAALAAEKEAIRLAAEQEAARQAALAAEAARQAALAEAARIEAEQQAILKAEEDRLAAEAAAKAEADRIAEEEAARIQAEIDAKAEADRLAAEEQARIEEEARIKAEEEARIEEEERLKAEADAKAAEEERIKAEEEAKLKEEAKELAEKEKAEKAAEKAEEDKLAKIAEEAKAGKELSEEEVTAVVSSLLEDLKPGESISAAAVIASGVSYSDLPADTPIEVRVSESGEPLIITAEVAANIELVQDPGALLEAAFTDPGAALAALGSIGADMTPGEREEATEMVVATVVAAGAAISAAATAAGGSTGGSSGGGSSGGGSGANSPGTRGGRKW